MASPDVETVVATGTTAVSGEKPAASRNSSVSSDVSRRTSAQRRTPSRYRGRVVMPSFQRSRVGRLASAKVGNCYNFGTLKSLNETHLQLGVYTMPWESESVR